MQKYEAAKRNTFVYICDGDGYSFCTNKTKGDILYMLCRQKDCTVSLVYNRATNTIMKQKNLHNHVKDAQLQETLSMRGFLRNRAKSSNDAFEKIFLEAEAKFPTAASLRGNVNYYKSSMHRSRRSCNPETPKNFEDICNMLRDSAKYSTDNDITPHPFFDDLYRDADNYNLLVFTSHRVVEEVRRQAAITIQSDATYKCVPRVKDFYQLFIISYQFERNVYPIMYVIMEKKTEKSYVKVFEILKTLLPTTQINTCMSDYEAALRKAVRNVFPGITVKGCFFHFKKAVLRRARKLKLILPNNDEIPDAIRGGVKYAGNLALLPERCVSDGISLVETKLDNSPKCLEFIQYLRRQWDKEDISVYKDKIRTNNGSESMHRRIITLLGQPHPGIFTFLEFLQKFEHHISLELSRNLKKNFSSNYRKKAYVAADERISKAEDIFEKNNDVDMFLSIVSGYEQGTICRCI